MCPQNYLPTSWRGNSTRLHFCMLCFQLLCSMGRYEEPRRHRRTHVPLEQVQMELTALLYTAYRHKKYCMYLLLSNSFFCHVVRPKKEFPVTCQKKGRVGTFIFYYMYFHHVLSCRCCT